MELGEAVATCFSGFNTVNDPRSGLKLDGPVAGVIDVRDPKAEGAEKNTNWAARMFHGENGAGLAQWTARNLGQVFGITLDDEKPPNIYLTTTTTYGLFKSSATNELFAGSFGPAGPGGVYKLSGTTGQIIQFAKLPNASIANPVSGPGLGDIAYDRVNRQFFVSNFYDGKIYRLAGVGHASGLAPGAVVDSYDFGTTHLGMQDPLVDQSPAFSSDNTSGGASGFRPVGRRPWAVQVYGGRLYFSIWGTDARSASDSATNTIWSMAAPAGTAPFSGPVKPELTMSRPLTRGGFPYSNPVSDIAFSAAGKMLVAERGMPNGDVGAYTPFPGHQSRVLEFTGGSGNWGPEKPFQIGGGPTGGIYLSGIRGNSEGGVDYGYDPFNYRRETPVEVRECDATVWATGELILGWGNVPRVYGLQAIPADGNEFNDRDAISPTNPGYSPLSWAIDLGGAPTDTDEAFEDKLRIGDVEVYRESCFPDQCLTVTSAQALCTIDGTGDYLLTFTFKNLTPDTIYHLFISGLSAGTATPTYIDLTHAPYTPVAPGGTQTIGPIRVHGAPPGALTFTISIHNIDLVQCCASEVTVELPPCDCAQIMSDTPPFCPFFSVPAITISSLSRVSSRARSATC